MKLRTKLLLYTILPIVLAVSVIIYNNYRLANAVIFTNIKNSLQSSTNFIAESVNLIFDDIRSSLYILSNTEAVRDAFGIEDHCVEEHSQRFAFLNDIAFLFPFSQDLFILDKNGKVIISTNSRDEGNNYGDREYFLQAKNGVFCVSQVLVSRVTNKETVYLANPVYINDSFAGVIVVSVQIEQLMSSLFSKTYIAPHMQVGLVKKNGQVISLLNATTLNNDIHAIYENIVNNSLKTKDFMLETANGVDYTGYFQRIEYNDWMVIIAVDNKDLYKLAIDSIVHSIALVVVCLIIIFGVVALTVTKLSSALIKGLHFAKKVTEGDFDAHLDSYSNDEIGKLYDALRTMMLTIKSTKNNLHAFIEEKDYALIQANENLSKESALIRIILDNMPDLIFYKNMDGVYEGCNMAFAKFVGKKSIDEVVGKTDNALFTPEFAAKFIDDDTEVRQSETHSKTIEEIVETSDKSTIILETVKTLYYAQSEKPLGLVGVSRDISLRKAAENAIALASAKAIEASNAKTEFLARMSHEIRTPLNAIIGMTFLMRSICTEPKQLDFLYKIDISAKNLLAVVNDVLDFSKIEAGKIDIERVAFNLQDVLDDIATINEARATASSLEFVTHIDERIVKTVLGDKLRLTQVLINLTSNAVKFTANGFIKVSIALEELDNEHQTCVFSVQDSGIGMSESQMEKLFSPFTQGDGSITRRYGGSGLGLAISKMLVDLMDGTLWVESTLDVGTTFSFRLTLELDSAEPVESPATALPEHHPAGLLEPKHVLVVEDNSINQEIAQELLHMFGLHVDIAENGEQAIQKCEENTYDLILMDIQMPVMNGYTATKILRDTPRYKDVPILAMTANAFSSDREACLEAGMNEHVAKPFDPAQLKRSLEKWLNTTLA